MDTPHSTCAILVCLAALLLAGVTLAQSVPDAADYVPNDPVSCLLCHSSNGPLPADAIMQGAHAVVGNARSPFAAGNAGCQSCHGPSASHLAVQANGAYLDRDAWWFGNFAGVNSKGFVPFLDFSLQSLPVPASGNVAYWRLEGQRLGLETGRLALEAGEQGRQRVRVQYRRLSSYQFDDARTPLLGAGSAALALPRRVGRPPGPPRQA